MSAASAVPAAVAPTVADDVSTGLSVAYLGKQLYPTTVENLANLLFPPSKNIKLCLVHHIL